MTKKREYHDFADLLKAWRKHTKLSQSAAAPVLGVSVRTLQDWEQRHRRPVLDEATVAILRRLSKDGLHL